MRQLLVVLGAAAVVSAFAPVVAAGPPVKAEFNFTFSSSFEDACPFPIAVTGAVSGRVSVVFAASGAWTEQYHMMEVDAFSANGKSLRGLPFTFNARWSYDAGGNLTAVVSQGVQERVPLPNGKFFLVAGRMDFFAHGMPAAMIIPDSGTMVNRDEFCEALAP